MPARYGGVGVTRARRYADGMSLAEIAAADQVTPHAAMEAIHRVVRRAVQQAPTGAELPQGFEWRPRSLTVKPNRPLKNWYVSIPNRALKAEEVGWALALSEGKRACTHCGRPF
jgi:hypothetical protein